MKLVFLVTFGYLLIGAYGQQTGSYFCRWLGAGNAKTIEVTITKDSNSPYEISSLVGLDENGALCDVVTTYTGGSLAAFDVEDNAGNPVTTCGVTNNAGEYTLLFHTSSCQGNCITQYDEEYTIVCPFAEPNGEASLEVDTTGQSITINAPDTGTATEHTETVALSILKADGSALDAATVLGTQLIVRSTLTLADGYATGVRVESCTIEDGDGDHTINFIEASGCASTVEIFPQNDGFSHNAAASTANSFYVSDSPIFPAFLFVDKGSDLLFKCTAKFCYGGTNGNCDHSCAAEAGKKRRKRRSATKEKEQRLMVILRVTTDNTTAISVHPEDKKMSATGECSNRSYMIGLVILGCVLVLTFIVSIGMFIILKRSSRQSNDCEKVGYVNKGAN